MGARLGSAGPWGGVCALQYSWRVRQAPTNARALRKVRFVTATGAARAAYRAYAMHTVYARATNALERAPSRLPATSRPAVHRMYRCISSLPAHCVERNCVVGGK